MKQHEIPHATQNAMNKNFLDPILLASNKSRPYLFRASFYPRFFRKGGDLRTTASFARQKVDGTQALTANDRGGWKGFFIACRIFIIF